MDPIKALRLDTRTSLLVRLSRKIEAAFPPSQADIDRAKEEGAYDFYRDMNFNAYIRPSLRKAWRYGYDIEEWIEQAKRERALVTQATGRV